MACVHVLEREQHFPRPRAELFEFFADASNLCAITPEFLKFRILTPMPIVMQAGAELQYQLRLWGLPVRWGTLIETFNTPASFVDRQVAGPYRLWHHTHTFEAVPGGTRMRDIVRYRLPYGPLGGFAHAVLVRRSLDRIFDYRAEALRRLFGTGRALGSV